MTPEQVRRFRHQLELSSPAFARALGVNDRTVRRYEQDEGDAGHTPAPPMLTTIMEACKDVPGFRTWLIARSKL